MLGDCRDAKYEDVFRPICLVLVVPDANETQARSKRPRRVIARPNGNDKAWHSVNVVRPLHQGDCSLASIAFAPMRREGCQAEFSTARAPLREIVRSGCGMKSNVTDHLAVAAQADCPKEPRLQRGLGFELTEPQR